MVRTESPVTGIAPGPEGEVSGVRYRDGRDGADATVSTGIVLANAAPHAIEKMLPETARPGFMARFTERPLSISLLSAMLGLDRTASAFGVTSYSTVLVPDWVERFDQFGDATPLFADAPAGRLAVMCMVDYGQIDSGLAEAGPHPVNTVCADRLSNWEGLEEDAYRARRAAWLDALIAGLDAEWPGIAGAVEASTIATARTMHDHLGTPQGAIYGFAMVSPERVPRQPPRDCTTAVEGLWLASAYVGFGGFTGAIGGGMAAAKAVLAA